MDEDIRSGWWKDHASGSMYQESRPNASNDIIGRYILVKDSTAIMISNVVAVMLTLSLPRLLVFIQLAVTYLTRRITRYFAEDEKNKDREMERLVPRDQNTQSQRRELQSPGSLPVQPSQAHVVDEFTREAENFIDIVNEAHAIENAAARIFRNYVIVGNDINVGVAAEDPLSILYAKAQLFLWNLRQQPWKTSTFLILYAFLFSIFLAYQIIAIFASRMIGPPIVRSASPHAGSWFPDKLDISYMSNTSIFPIANDLHTEITFRAVGYAERCYGHRSSSGDCDIFYTPRINYTQDHNATCPFQSDMCLEGPESAYELNTGFIDAKVLGVNYEHTCKFRLRHICAPLVADKRFIRSTPSNNPYLRIVEYFYGDGLGISGDNKTFGEVVMDPAKQLNVDIPRYIIR
jgi:hypothetical protein